MIFKKNIADGIEDKLIDIISKHKEDMDFNKKAEIARSKATQAEKHMLGAGLVSGLGSVIGVGGLAASLHMGVGSLALVVGGITTTVGGAILAGGVLGIAGPALAYVGISKLVKMYHESTAKDNSYDGTPYRKVEDSVKKSFSNKIKKILGGERSELYNSAAAIGLIGNIENGYAINDNTKKLIELSREINKEKFGNNKKDRVQDFKNALKI